VPSVPRPSPCFLDGMEYLGAPGGRGRWRSRELKRLYEWDSGHGEVEVYNLRGRHLGAADPVTGELIKPARRDRRIDV
jgi:Cytotoxic